jgi:hypothetical protein
MADFSDWLTKKQVAESLHVSDGDVDHYLSGEGLKSRQQRSADGQRPRCVYDPAIVETLRASFDKPNLEANPRLRSLVFNSPELLKIYASLGYSPCLRERMTDLAAKVRACCDPDSLAASEGSINADPKVLLTPNGAVSLHTELSFCCPLEDREVRVPVQHLWDWAVEARTALLSEVPEFGSPEGNRVSANNIRSILNAANAFDCEELPYEKKVRKEQFDSILWRIEVRIPRQDESDRSTDFAFLATEYLRAPWMHNRSLTERLAREVFKLLRKDVGKMAVPPRWPASITAVAAAVFYYFWGMAMALLPVFLTLGLMLPIIYRAWEVNRLAREVDRVAREIEEDWFAGKILANRVERLYRFGTVPSVLPALLELLQ